VSAADVLDEGVPGADGLARSEAFEAALWPQPSLEPTVIGLDPVALSPGIDAVDLRQRFVQGPGVGRGPVSVHLRQPALPPRPDEEPARGEISVLGGHDVDDLPELDIRAPNEQPRPISRPQG
jgi:hypothetical protein